MKCYSKNRENIKSNFIHSRNHRETNFIEVRCKDCGMFRYETRIIGGGIEVSKWFKPIKNR